MIVPFNKKDYDILCLAGYSILKNKINFIGEGYKVSNFWISTIPIKDIPIKYLEIGVFYGANAISMLYTYCNNKDSEIHCIDPWGNYEGLVEATHKDEQIFDDFVTNISRTDDISKFYVYRGQSKDKIPLLKNDYFDIIYIDGNHEPEYILEDAVLSFRKLKVGGYMIFDDYTTDDYRKAIDSFIKCYFSNLILLKISNCQVFIQKISKKN